MKLKNVLKAVLSVSLVASLSIAGTVAYLQSEDSDVNVMTLGNIDIEQHEYERVQNTDGTYEMVSSEKYGEGYKLQEFTQAKPLYPATGAITGWGTKVPFDQIEGASGAQAVLAGLNNVQDKFVLVENTGKSNAYVRTLIALEYGSNTKDIIGITTGDFWTWNEIGIIEVDDNNYYLFEAIYKGSDTRHVGGVLPAGDYTYNSLGQIYLANEATNEDCEALDGNKNGTYDILVFSQAVQTEGFTDAQTALDTAFGDITTTNHPWNNGIVIPTVVSSAEELKAALKAGKNVVLADDITLTNGIAPADGSVINLNGYTVIDSSTGGRTFGAQNGASIVINGEGAVRKDSTVSSTYAMPLYISNGTVTVNGGNFEMGSPEGVNYSILLQNSGKLIINNGTFTNTSNYPLIYAIYSSIVEINNGYFESIGAENPDLLDIEYHASRISTITIKGGTFVNYNPSEDNEGDRVVVADGYKVVSETQDNGDVWYTVVPE